MDTKRLNSLVLRDYSPTSEEIAGVQSKARDIYFLLDNVQDTYNIGSFFRLADAVGAKKIWLTGVSECPPNVRISKAAVGTDRWVPWQYVQNAKQAIAYVRNSVPNLMVVGIEQNSRSISFEKCRYQLPLLLVVGHESTGVSDDVLEMCDYIVELPMFGINVSMNVVMSAAMVLGRL